MADVLLDCGPVDTHHLAVAGRDPRPPSHLVLALPADEAAAILAAFRGAPLVQSMTETERSGDRGSAGRVNPEERAEVAACTEDPQKDAEHPQTLLRVSA